MALGFVATACTAPPAITGVSSTLFGQPGPPTSSYSTRRSGPWTLRNGSAWAWKTIGWQPLAAPTFTIQAWGLPSVAAGCRSAYLSRFRGCSICDRLLPVAPAWLFLKKGWLSSRLLVDGTSCGAPGRLVAHLFLGAWVHTPCRWELSRLLNSIKGRQAAKATGELAETEVDLGAGLNGSLRESMCQAAIRILRATAPLAALVWRERRPRSV